MGTLLDDIEENGRAPCRAQWWDYVCSADRIFDSFRALAALFCLIWPSSMAHAIQIGPDDISLVRGLPGDERTFHPRRDTPAWHYTLPLDWSANPYNDLNWQSQLHMWRIMDPLLTRYFKDGNLASLDYAAKIAVDWLHWHKSQEARFSWDDMGTGIRALKIAFLISMIDNGKLSSDYRDEMLDLAREHATRLQVDKFINSGNHGLFQVFGLNLLCSVVNIMECADGRRFAAEKFKWILSHQFTRRAFIWRILQLTTVLLSGSSKD
ncbi:hypothetical protein HED49_06670 [Ochrobactrum daejeonense]|nr:hypothetical protein [Brucella daejeonensis]